MFGIRFTFVATRSGLTRVRHFIDDKAVSREALAFARRHHRGPDETFYKRAVDYNMLINETATLITVPFNMHQKIEARLSKYEMDQLDRLADEMEATSATTDIYSSDTKSQRRRQVVNTEEPYAPKRVNEMDLFEKLDILANSSIHAIATQTIIVNEGNQRAVAGVTGVFYDYAQFVQRLLNTTNSDFQQQQSNNQMLDKVRCGYMNDTIDCLLVDNNGYIVVSEELEFVGRHLKAYDPQILSRLVSAGVYHEVNVTDYQSICLDPGDKQAGGSGPSSSASGNFMRIHITGLAMGFLKNLANIIVYSWTILATIIGHFIHSSDALTLHQSAGQYLPQSVQLTTQPSMQSLIPTKTYLRPCEKVLIRYETRPGVFNSDTPEYYTTQCNCPAWFVYEQVAQTNLILIIVDTTPSCRYKCNEASATSNQQQSFDGDSLSSIIGQNDKQVCSMIERESKLYKKTLESCYSRHPEEEHIRLCGSAFRSAHLSNILILVLLIINCFVISRK